MLSVLLWKDVLSNPDGIPGEWPAEVDTVADDAEVLPPRIKMTEEEYAAYRASVQHLFDAWQAEQDRLRALREEAELKKQEAIAKVDAGRELIGEMEALFVLNEFTVEEKAAVIVAIQDILLMLLTGQHEKAKELLAGLKPDIKLTEQKIAVLQELITKIEAL